MTDAVAHPMIRPGREWWRGLTISGLAQMLRQGLQLAVMLLLARALSPAAFGTFGMAMLVVGLAQVVAEGGVTVVVVQAPDWSEAALSGVFWRNLAGSLLIAAGVAGAALVAARLVPGRAFLPIVPMLVWVLPIAALGRVPLALLQRRLDWLAVEAAGVAGLIGGGLAALGAIGLGRAGATVLVAQALIGAGCTSGVALILSGWWPAWSWQGRAGRRGRHFATYGLLDALQRQADDWLVGWRFGVVSLGHYGRAHALLAALVQAVAGPINATMVPLLSRLQDRPSAWRGLFERVCLGAGLVMLLVQSAGMVWGRQAVPWLLGGQWRVAGVLFVLTMPALVPLMLTNCWTWVYLATAQGRTLLRLQAVWLAVLGALLAMGSAWGVTGVALAWSGGAIGWSCVRQALAFRDCPVPALTPAVRLAVAGLHAASAAEFLWAFRMTC